jgi:hypothetical protein
MSDERKKSNWRRWAGFVVVTLRGGTRENGNCARHIGIRRFAAYVDYALLRQRRHNPSGWPTEYTEHLYIIGGVAFQPFVAIAAGGIIAAFLFGLGAFLLFAGRE